MPIKRKTPSYRSPEWRRADVRFAEKRGLAGRRRERIFLRLDFF
jgi:hypothetical protein